MTISKKKRWGLTLATGFAVAFTHSAFAQANCRYIVNNDWGGGAVATIEITNTSTSAINGWSVNWAYQNSKLVNSWNANITGSNPFSATNMSWNASLQPGQAVTFGVQVSMAGGRAETPTINGSICGGGMTSSSSPVSSSSSLSSTRSISSASSSSSIRSSSSSLLRSSSSSPGSSSSSSSQAPLQACSGGVENGRLVECLDSGVIAVPKGGDAFISWRLLGTDPANTGFNLYRRNAGASNATLVCSRAASQPTWCIDRNDSTGAQYFVRPTTAGTEGVESRAATLQAQNYLRIPLRAASAGAYVHLGWVGDLTGDGEYDVIVDRITNQAPLVDAYTHTGRFLWRLNTGPLGVDRNNIEGGASTISNGHWDGLTVFDFDSDGRAEVAIKTARGFVFGDGRVLSHSNDRDQFVSIVNGLTGAEITRAPMPADYINDGPLQCHFGAGYLDGVHPSVFIKCKNRIGNGGFNKLIAAYDFDGATLTQRWKWKGGGPDFHQIRILDVNGDGKDEIADGGYVINGDGTMLYNLSVHGVIHGDRFHITDMDPSRPGLEGFGIQQNNSNGLETYYYDAATGNMIRRHYAANGGPAGDLGRGTVADLYANSPGMEYWSFNGMYSAATGQLLVPEVDRNVPWPNFQMQWDGDLGSELLDNNRVGDWNLTARSRNTYSWRETFSGLVQARGALPFYGDIFGDWREEVMIESSDNSELRIYTTTHETDHRLYTLVHNPAYRNGLTVQGYKQSHHVDYFLGFGMQQPPAPRIKPVNRN